MRKISLIFFASFFLSGTCSPPRWVYRLPQNYKSSKISEELNGLWERPVLSPYSISDPNSGIAASEIIKITDRNYTKEHLYSENVQGLQKIQIYIETGKIETDGTWILLKPENAKGFLYEEKKKKKNSSFSPPELPSIEKHKLKDVKLPKPLLFYLNRPDMTLLPAAMERMGRTFEYGLYENTVHPYDADSEKFLNGLNSATHKKFYRQGYRKRR
ncbi:MAG: hypothetical protein OEZ34_13585 [Spirochaetia bacterium]|nr:hypothetical protein [Spirochaetia bacterium]